MSERYKKVLEDHLQASNKNSEASGTMQVKGEREEILDDIVLDLND